MVRSRLWTTIVVVMLAACVNKQEEALPIEGIDDRDTGYENLGPPSEECFASARQAIERIEVGNGLGVEVKGAKLVAADDDHELLRLQADRDGEEDHYVAAVEPLAGSCPVYGVARADATDSLVDSGSMADALPSEACEDVALAAVEHLEAVNGWEGTVGPADRLQGDGEDEIMRIRVERAGGSGDDYVVIARPERDRCLVRSVHVAGRAADLSTS